MHLLRSIFLACLSYVSFALTFQYSLEEGLHIRGVEGPKVPGFALQSRHVHSFEPVTLISRRDVHILQRVKETAGKAESLVKAQELSNERKVLATFPKKLTPKDERKLRKNDRDFNPNSIEDSKRSALNEASHLANGRSLKRIIARRVIDLFREDRECEVARPEHPAIKQPTDPKLTHMLKWRKSVEKHFPSLSVQPPGLRLHATSRDNPARQPALDLQVEPREHDSEDAAYGLYPRDPIPVEIRKLERDAKKKEKQRQAAIEYKGSGKGDVSKIAFERVQDEKGTFARLGNQRKMTKSRLKGANENLERAKAAAEEADKHHQASERYVRAYGRLHSVHKSVNHFNNLLRRPELLNVETQRVRQQMSDQKAALKGKYGHPDKKFEAFEQAYRTAAAFPENVKQLKKEKSDDKNSVRERKSRKSYRDKVAELDFASKKWSKAKGRHLAFLKGVDTKRERQEQKANMEFQREQQGLDRKHQLDSGTRDKRKQLARNKAALAAKQGHHNEKAELKYQAATTIKDWQKHIDAAKEVKKNDRGLVKDLKDTGKQYGADQAAIFEHAHKQYHKEVGKNLAFLKAVDKKSRKQHPEVVRQMQQFPTSHPISEKQLAEPDPGSRPAPHQTIYREGSRWVGPHLRAGSKGPRHELE